MYRIVPFRWIILSLAVIPSSILAQPSDKLPPAAQPLADANNDLDAVYLPARLSGRWEDRFLKVNVHWPKDDRKHPCLIFVHGGGYLGGDKDGGFGGAGGPPRDVMARALRMGFVVANPNYILGRDLYPQVFYDFKTLVRFLRANAEKYHIDPDRIGVWGFSAGGWLSSSACFCDAGDIYLPDRKLAVSENWPLDDPRRALTPGKQKLAPFAVPMDDADPLYGRYSARVQALQADFHHYQTNVTSSAPAICTYVGDKGVSDLDAPVKAAAVDYLPLVLKHPTKKFDGAKSVHVPPLTMKVPSPDGKDEIDLGERVLLWFKERLIDDPRTPAPEFRPNRRVFAERIAVEVVLPSSGSRVHYTTDGSTPTTQSPVWEKPLTLTNDTLLRAMAVKEGMRPSGVATARFTKGEGPPAIRGPKEMPRGKVGKPYEATFTAEENRGVVWRLTAHYRPDDGLKYKGDFADYVGLSFDAEKGVLSGTPKRAGAYTLLIQAARGPGKIADTRTYVLIVE